MEPKMKVILMILFLLIAFSNCKTKNESSLAGDSARVIYEDEEYFCKLMFESKDSSTYRLLWGTRDFSAITSMLFDIHGNGYLNLVGRTVNSFILTQGCGTSCKYVVILPLEKGKEELVYYLVKAIDTAKNLIAYSPGDDSTFLTIENYINKKKLSIVEQDLCPAVNLSDCLDTCYFSRDHLIYKWNGAKWRSGFADIKEGAVIIDLLMSY